MTQLDIQTIRIEADNSKERVCGNCRHNVRTGEPAHIECHCDFYGHYISYISCYSHWCKHWAKDREN